MGAAVKSIPTMEAPEQPRSPRRIRSRKLFEPELVRDALKQSFVMLRPDIQWSNPVMFVVEIGAVLTLLFVVQALVSTSASMVPITYFIALDAWLFLTVLFANFATALAEARGKAQAESLRKTRGETPAYRLKGTNTIEEVFSTALRPGDRVVISAGQVVPSDRLG
jgi:potassium-transporting ATPase ATP-binding subunit